MKTSEIVPSALTAALATRLSTPFSGGATGGLAIAIGAGARAKLLKVTSPATRVPWLAIRSVTRVCVCARAGRVSNAADNARMISKNLLFMMFPRVFC